MDRFRKVICRCLASPLLLWLPVMHFAAKKPEKFSEDTRYSIAMRFVKGISKHAKADISVYGLENIPEDTGCLICPNHQDKFDPLAIWLTYPYKTSVVAADKACHRPVIASFMPAVDGVKLPQDSLRGMYEMTQRVAELLKGDKSCILFPEGDYEENCHELMPFMSGCFKSPMKAEKPILPVALINSCNVFRNFNSSPAKMQIHYLEPIYPDQYQGLKTKDIAEIVRERIQDAINTYQSA